MFRHKNTDAHGKPFPAAVVQAVWDKTATAPGHGPLKVDAFGSLMWWQAFGNTSSKLGWEIRHRIPVEDGGGDNLDNLEAIQWENHRRLESARPQPAVTDPGSGTGIQSPATQIEPAQEERESTRVHASLIPAELLKAAAVL